MSTFGPTGRRRYFIHTAGGRRIEVRRGQWEDHCHQQRLVEMKQERLAELTRRMDNDQSCLTTYDDLLERDIDHLYYKPLHDAEASARRRRAAAVKEAAKQRARERARRRRAKARLRL